MSTESIAQQEVTSARQHAQLASRVLVGPDGQRRDGRGTTEERVARAEEAQAHALTSIALTLAGATSDMGDLAVKAIVEQG